LKPDRSPDGSPEGVRRSVENCVKILDGKKKIDLFQCARVDTEVPIETTIGTLAELVKEGKIGGISLSEASAETIRRAAKVHKVSAVEVEVSLWQDHILTNGVADACFENGIPVVAYSPIGRGFLTGQIQSLDDLPEGDFRRQFPRFRPENFDKNLQLVHEIQEIAHRKGVTPAQLAIAWVRQLSDRKVLPVFIPIPGASREDRVKQNCEIVELNQEELTEISKVLASFEVLGDRYPEMFMNSLDR
jgi:pyridoxine 4-dehydrogenase